MIIENVAALRPETLFDVAVVGTGPAGMSVARRLAERGKRVVLLEAGDRFVTEQSQSAYRGEVVGDPYFDLEFARLRCLGGTSGHWNGACRSLDEVDFAPKADFPLARSGSSSRSRTRRCALARNTSRRWRIPIAFSSVSTPTWSLSGRTGSVSRRPRSSAS